MYFPPLLFNLYLRMSVKLIMTASVDEYILRASEFIPDNTKKAACLALNFFFLDTEAEKKLALKDAEQKLALKDADQKLALKDAEAEKKLALALADAEQKLALALAQKDSSQRESYLKSLLSALSQRCSFLEINSLRYYY